jgi:AbrB family looped-hinge helix DNA binding protein
MARSTQGASEVQVTATPDGRVTIPAPLRRAAGIEPGQRLVVSVEDGRVVLESWTHLLARVQRRVAEATAGHESGILASEELIAERRAEAAREDASSNATVDGAA